MCNNQYILQMLNFFSANSTTNGISFSDVNFWEIKKHKALNQPVISSFFIQQVTLERKNIRLHLCCRSHHRINCLKSNIASYETIWRLPLKSTSPFPSVSNMSITRCTSGFWCNSGKDINSSTLSEPDWSRSSLRNRFPSLLISSASTAVKNSWSKQLIHHLQRVCLNTADHYISQSNSGLKIFFKLYIPIKDF